MSSRSLSPGFFDPRNYKEDDNENERDDTDNQRDERETFDVLVPQNAMASPNALTAMIAWWFASSSPGCQCGGGGERRRGITKIYTY